MTHGENGMRGSSVQDKIVYWFQAGGAPFTKALIVANVLTFLALILGRAYGLIAYLGFDTAAVFIKPWSVLTYPILGECGILCLIFSVYWLWIVGSSLERSWGTRGFALFFFGISAVSALGLYVGATILGERVNLANIALPLAAVTIAWAMLNPEQQILFMFVIPLKLKHLALLDAALVFLWFGQQNILLGVFGLVGCAASYWHVMHGRRTYFTPGRYEGIARDIRIRPTYAGRARNWNPIRWYKDYRQRKKLRDLFDRSDYHR